MTEHKAYLFDYDAFDRELRPILEDALRSASLAPLLDFIHIHLSILRDPYEGDPLGADWESMVEPKDAHQYGDFALTKYYDPSDDIGLSPWWWELDDLLAKDPDLTESPLLGHTIGPRNNLFDPGKMGSYFQSAQQVRANHQYLVNLATQVQREDLTHAIEMLQRAVEANRGLYVTF